jgi:hypothetical protein
VKKILSIFLLATVIFTSLASSARADGMILPPDEYYLVYETEQKGFLIYEDGREELVISIGFNGEASEFGWIVPFPTRPEVSKVDSSIFEKLYEFTLPKENLLEKIRGESNSYPMYGAVMEEAAVDTEEAKSTVEVLEEDSIGIYDYAVLEAGDPGDLRDWMEDNGYNLPGGDEDDDYYWGYDSQTQEELWSEALPVIQSYIEDEWYFVTVRINNKFTDSSGVEKKLEQGSVDPLRFSFETSDLIYPMKLTGIAQRSMAVTLYVIDDHKMRVDNYNYNYCSSDDEDCSYFNINYASKVSKDEIADLTKEVGKGSWYEAEGDMYITKLSASSLSYGEMDEEVLFTDTSSNQGINDGSMSFWEWVQLPFVVLIFLPYLLMGGFFEVLDSGYYYGDLGIGWFIGISALLFFGSILWSIISILLLKRTKRKFKRFIIYALQFPSIWLASFCLSLIVAIPFGLLVSAVGQDTEVALIDGLCCLSFTSVLVPVVFYRLVWRRRNRKTAKQKK